MSKKRSDRTGRSEKDTTESDLKKLTQTCNEVLRVSKEHAYLWDKGLIDSRGLGLCGGFIAQDESWGIAVRREQGKFFFDGRNYGPYDSKGLTGVKAAEAMREYHISPTFLREAFYESLAKPLGRYLAKKKIKQLLGYEPKKSDEDDED